MAMMGDSGGREAFLKTSTPSPTHHPGHAADSWPSHCQASPGYAQLGPKPVSEEALRNLISCCNPSTCVDTSGFGVVQGCHLHGKERKAEVRAEASSDSCVTLVGKGIRVSECVANGNASTAVSVHSGQDDKITSILRFDMKNQQSVVLGSTWEEEDSDRKPIIAVIGEVRDVPGKGAEARVPCVLTLQPHSPHKEGSRDRPEVTVDPADQAGMVRHNHLNAGATTTSPTQLLTPPPWLSNMSGEVGLIPVPAKVSSRGVPVVCCSKEEGAMEGQAEDCHPHTAEEASTAKSAVHLSSSLSTRETHKIPENSKMTESENSEVPENSKMTESENSEMPENNEMPENSKMPENGKLCESSVSLLDKPPSASCFTVTPSMYSNSDTDEYTDYEQKPVIQDGKVLTKHEKAATGKTNTRRRGRKSKMAHRKRYPGLPDADSKAGIPLVEESAQNLRRSTRSKVSVKRESVCVDKVEWDFEPHEHFQEKPSTRTAKRVLPIRVRRPKFSTSYKESSGDSDDTAEIAKTVERVSPKTKAIRTGVSRPGNKTCPVCHKTFTRTESLTVHMRVHTGERPFQCEHCDATYKVSSHLRNHVRSKHSATKEYVCANCSKAFATPNAKGRHEKTCGKDLSERVKFHCNRCSKGFVTSEGFERHKNLDSCCPQELGEEPVDVSDGEGREAGEKGGPKSEDRPFKCTQCGKTFDQFTNLDCHQRFLCGRARGGLLYACPQCSKQFTKWSRYLAHCRRHAGHKPFPCSHCSARFFDRECLRKHVARHEGRNKVKCSLCDKMFSAKSRLSMHIMRVHCGMKPYKCNECDSDFASATLLSTHIRRVHRKEKRFKCQLCHKAFFEAQAWMKHMLLHASGRDPAVRGPVQQYPCRLCGQVMNMRLMRLHVETDHPGIPLSQAVTKALVTCKLCKKEFSDSSSLKIHMVRHSGRKDFKCDQCDMAFVTVHALQIHQRKHTDARPYTCEECGDTFRWRASLRDHKINVHSPGVESEGGDGRRFTCKECGQRFKRYNSLKSHLIRHRSVMPCICSQCGKGFTDTTRLKIHMSCHAGSDRPFICETCGAGFFYTFLLKRHIQSRHKPSPWLCNLCGRSLCSKDALKRHLQHHANSPDGKVRVGGNRGRKRKLAEPTAEGSEPQGVDKEQTEQVEGRTELEQLQDGHHDAAQGMVSNSLQPPLAEEQEPFGKNFVDLSTSSSGISGGQASSIGMLTGLPYPYPTSTFVLDMAHWPKPQGQ